MTDHATDDSGRTPAAALGLAARPYFPLRDAVFVNHGSYGSTPLPVLAAQDAARRQMESWPSHFFAKEAPRRIRETADTLGGFLGVNGHDLVFTANASDGTNAVLSSLRLSPSDEIVLHDQTYEATKLAAARVCRRAGAAVRWVRYPVPWHGEDLNASFVSAIGPRTRLVVLDHILSSTGALMPVAEIVQAIRATREGRALPILIDGAHGPGQVAVDIDAIGATYYTSNAHKWLLGPKGVGLLWVAKEAQADIGPNIASLQSEMGFLRAFDYPGTRDPSGILSLSACLRFRADVLGGEAAIQHHARTLVHGASRRLLERWGTELAAPLECHGSMAAIRLPSRATGTKDAALQLQDRLWQEHRVDTKVTAIGGALWLRISCAPYNVVDDFEQLGEAVDRCMDGWPITPPA